MHESNCKTFFFWDIQSHNQTIKQMLPAYLGEILLILSQNQWWLGVFERSEAGRFSQRE